MRFAHSSEFKLRHTSRYQVDPLEYTGQRYAGRSGFEGRAHLSRYSGYGLGRSLGDERHSR